MSVPQRYGITFPVRRHPAARAARARARARRPRLHRPVVGGVGRLRRVHPARGRRAVGARAPARHRDRARVHAWRAHARVDGRVDVPGRARPLRARHRHVVERDRRALERHDVRQAVPARARHDPLPARRAHGREGHRGRTRRSRCNGFRLGITVPEQPPILVAALREGMLRLAGREGDGAIVNWLSADDVKTVAPHVGADKEIAARIFVLPVRRRRPRVRGRQARDRVVPHRAGLRRVPRVARARRRSSPTCGDSGRKATARPRPSRSPNEVVDELLVWGKPEQCREHIQRYIDNGVTTPAPALFCGPDELPAVLRALRR